MDSPDETLTHISAGKVQGTPVVTSHGEPLGEITTSCWRSALGGSLTLSCVPDAGGYVVCIPDEALRSGPILRDTGTWDNGLADRINRYYQRWLNED
jgi:hypothetical protein